MIPIGMSPALTPRAAAYLGPIALQIEKKLQRVCERHTLHKHAERMLPLDLTEARSAAVASASQSRNLLQDLFADVALEVDDRAKDIIFDEGDVVNVADGRYGRTYCFYDVLAAYFVCMPQNGEVIIDLIVQLWSRQSFATNIFCLLFYKRMFEVQFDDPEVVLRYSSSLVQGAKNVFWIDIQTNERRFLSLFHYLLDEVAFSSERLKKISSQAQKDLFLLLSRFLFFYDSADRLEVFLEQFPEFPNAFLIGGAPDIFVTELADQLQELKVEPVLLHYFSQIKDLQGLELRIATSTRLKACLYSFTSPGGPMYPTRTVRHAAWDALNYLFPVGKYPRQVISLFFRLLYPWYWPSSCWNFVSSCIKPVLYSLFLVLFSAREKLAKSRTLHRNV